MKIAVTYDRGEIFQHFGHTEHFMVYDVENGKIKDKKLLSSGESGHGALAGLLRGEKVDTLICGGIGGGARAALEEADIRLYGGASGSADAAVEALLAGKLSYDPLAKCDHHGEHEKNHSCGEHGCGSHSCGNK